MGMDFFVTGATLNKQKLEAKGFQFFINDEKYYHSRYMDFTLDFRKPRELMQVLYKDAVTYQDEHSPLELRNDIMVLSSEKIKELVKNELSEEWFKDKIDLPYYYKLMEELIKYIDNDNFYLFMEASY